MREAEAAIHSLRETLRKAPTRIGTKHPQQIRLPSHHVLPMHLQIGDRFYDETGEWEVIGRPFITAPGKNAHARVRKVGKPELTDLRTWGAHERVSVQRAE